MVSEQKKISPKERRTFFYTGARWIAQILFHTIGPVEYLHPERIHVEAPFILVSNHWSNMDPFLAGYLIRDQEVTFLGKKELTKNALLRALFRHMHMIPIDRHNTDMEAMRACTRALKEGEILGIFPEGTRHHKGVMEQPENGIALIALRAKVPVLPIYIHSKYRLFRKNRVCIGQALKTDDLIAQGVNRESCETLMKRIKEAYQEMIQEVTDGHS